MKFNIKAFLVTIFTLIAVFVAVSSVKAAVCSGTEDCQSKIKEYEEKLNSARTQRNSLSSQVKFMDTKIELAEIKIVNTEKDIQNTASEIDQLSGKIEQLNASLDHLSVILLEKIVEGYKKKKVGFLEILLNPNSALLSNQNQYIQITQVNDQRMALRTQQIKNNFSEQKSLREVKKEELEELEISLIQQKKVLDVEKAQKSALLEQTKNDEAKYQTLLAQALSEFQAVNQAISSGQKVGPVKKGDPIALIGNTGYPHCSTGKHLHYEVRQNGTWVNPRDFSGPGKQWDMPIKDPIYVGQEFGHTPYSWRYTYSGGIHTGIDMNSGSSDVIYAPADGTLYTSSQNCSGAIIKIKYIDHGSGMQSFYLHVQ